MELFMSRSTRLISCIAMVVALMFSARNEHAYFTRGGNWQAAEFYKVKSAIQSAHYSSPVDGIEAIALVGMLKFAESLQLDLKAAIKRDADRLQHFMPITEMIMDMFVSRPLVRRAYASILFIVLLFLLSDTLVLLRPVSSSALKRSREQVLLLENKGRILLSRAYNLPKDPLGNDDVGLWLSQKIKDHFKIQGKMEINLKYVDSKDPSYMIRPVLINASDNVYCTLLA